MQNTNYGPCILSTYFKLLYFNYFTTLQVHKCSLLARTTNSVWDQGDSTIHKSPVDRPPVCGDYGCLNSVWMQKWQNYTEYGNQVGLFMLAELLVNVPSTSLTD